MRGKHSQLFDKTGFIDRSNLIQHHLSGYTLKRTVHAGRIITPLAGHRRNNDCAYIGVHLIGRNNHTGPCLFDFSPLCRVKRNKVDIEPLHFHSHSEASHFDADIVSSIRVSSFCSAIFWNASPQPLRDLRAGRITTAPCSTVIKASVPNAHCSMKGFGIRTPLEFPIATNVVFIARIVITLCLHVKCKVVSCSSCCAPTAFSFRGISSISD